MSCQPPARSGRCQHRLHPSSVQWAALSSDGFSRICAAGVGSVKTKLPNGLACDRGSAQLLSTSQQHAHGLHALQHDGARLIVCQKPRGYKLGTLRSAHLPLVRHSAT